MCIMYMTHTIYLSNTEFTKLHSYIKPLYHVYDTYNLVGDNYLYHVNDAYI